VELGGAFTLVDNWDRKGLGGFRLAVEGLVRLPTGIKADPEVAFPAPGDDGQMDVQLLGAADLGRGNVGLRVTGGYLLQLSAASVRRVAAPGTLLVPVTSRAEVSFDPGDELFLGFTPFFRLARPLAIFLGVQYRHRSADGASYTGAAVPGVDPAVLGEGTGHTALLFSAGHQLLGDRRTRRITGARAHRCRLVLGHGDHGIGRAGDEGEHHSHARASLRKALVAAATTRRPSGAADRGAPSWWAGPSR
jgi:hypothetical protein